MSALKVAILGAGPGGLAAALALLARGAQVTVYERAPALQPVGAGLTLFPNGLRALDRIAPGLGQAMVDHGSPCLVSLIYDDAGALLHQSASTMGERYGYPMTNLRWSDMVGLLAARLPPGVLRLGCAGVAVEGDALRLASGERVQAEALIAADGVHSVARAALLQDGPPRWSGRVSWRLLVPPDPALLPRHHAAFYLARGAQQGRSVGLFDLGAHTFVSASAICEAMPAREDGARAQERVVAMYAGFQAPIAALYAAARPEDILERPIWDRPPAPRLAAGRVALLGDAAHPVEPSLGQGANLAFEDALALGALLAQADPDGVPEALARYSAIRLQRVTMVQARSAASGATAASGDALTNAREAIDQLQRTPGGFEDWLFSGPA